MKVDNIKQLSTNTTLPNTKHIASDGATAATRPAMQSVRTPTSSDAMQIMQQHAQIANWQTKNVSADPSAIYNLYKQRRLGDRRLSNGDNSNEVPAMHPEVMEEVFGLLNGLKSVKVNVLVRKLFKRIGHTKNIIDSNYDVEDDDEKQETQDVKRKTTSKVTKEDVRTALEEMIEKDPTNAYLIIESAKRELGLTGANAKNPKDYTEIDKAVIDFAKENYAAHGVQIRADINIANEIDKSKNKTLFRELYYSFIQYPQLVQLIDIRKIFIQNSKNIEAGHIEFMEATNLFSQAAKNDRDGEKKGRLPTSDPNTIHDAISVMDKRSKIDSFYKNIKKFKAKFGSYIDQLNGKEAKNQTEFNGLDNYLSNQIIKSKV